MHICFVVHEYLDTFERAEDLLKSFHSFTEWCEALEALGVQITAIIRFKKNARIREGKIDYQFVDDGLPARLSFWQIPRKLHQIAAQVPADLFHLHNMNKVLQHRHLLQCLKGSRPVLIQNHAETPRFWLRNQLQKRVFPQVNALLFCASGQEEIWQRKRILSRHNTIYYLMEGSTHFSYQAREQARAATGMSGSPVFLWVGNLNENKNPLGILKAFEANLSTHPQARLYFLYQDDGLLPTLQNYLRSAPLLAQVVHLLGSRPRHQMADHFNSADYFILGSHREGSGYALLEAMACGCVPIVTDIPSFRMMTDQGRLGPLSPPGDWKQMAQSIEGVLQGDWQEQSTAVRQFFDTHLSYPAIARQLLRYYQEISQKFGQDKSYKDK
ncbi:MAG: glycosyltransferase family 4 protein [Bacteroidota bacterium]